MTNTLTPPATSIGSGSGPAAPARKGLLAKVNPIWLLALLCAVIASFGALQILGSAAQTTTYYVLNRAVPERTQITADMLSPVVTAVGGQPPNAMDPATVTSDALFATVPLKPGDVVTTSVAGPLTRINANLPANFRVASISVDAKNAVAGKIRTGDYIDIAAISSGGDGDASAAGKTAKIVFAHVLVLDVATDPSTIQSSAQDGQAASDLNPGPESDAVRDGIPSLYTVALSPSDFTKMALIKDQPLYLALSPNQVQSSTDVQTQLGSVFNPDGVPDSGAGTKGSPQTPTASPTPSAGSSASTPSASASSATP